MLSKSKATQAMTVLALAVSLASWCEPASAQQAVRIGTSSVGSTFYVISIAMSKMIQTHASLNATVEPLGGSHANMFGLAADKVDFAVANSGAAFDRLHGEPPFKEKFALRLVAQGQPSFRGIVVRRDSGINKPEDIVDKIISARRRPLPELEKIANALIKVYNLPKDRIQLVSSVNMGEMSSALRGGSVHGAVFPFGLKQPVATKLFHDRVIRFLQIPEQQYEQMLALLPKSFYKATVPANNFENQPEPVRTFGLSTLLVTSDKLPEETVYKVTKAVMGHPEEFSKFHAEAKHWTVNQTLTEPKVPFHAGAIRFYKEIGQWNAELDRIQQDLLRQGQ
ncbi:MAG TPA: TAXI family TRAP transporter solute-binding subunit [Candidatus Binatia bacterium]|nr:TAXI family TRAP transporter solute-binding subunit [Candidatus Binatia bacterium]